MTRYRTTLGHLNYAFDDLRAVMAKASPPRSGDSLAEIAAATAQERIAAKYVLADLPLTRFLDEPLIDGEHDEVTRLIYAEHDPAAFAPLAAMTVGEFREHLLAYETTTEAITSLAAGITPEMAAAVSKLCRNQDLVLIASKCSVVSRFRNTLGLPGRLAVRLQPNHPTDDLHGIAASILDGLLYGCGDAVIGVNPATDNLAVTADLLKMIAELIERFGIPTQSCVLAHVTTSLRAMAAGAPLDLVFQSIAGTEAANKSFGVNLALLEEAHQAALALRRGTVGTDCMYFETGQGTCLSADAHHGVDQQTLEARAYAVARKFRPLLVNTVVGFIGPEYLYDGKQILRAGLEDHFCGKLLGLPMGVDVCYTNHAEADQDDMDNLLTLLGAAGVNYIMGVPGADDIMLNYQSTSFHDAAYLRQLLKLRPAPEFEAWMQRMAVLDGDCRLLPVQPGRHLLGLRAGEDGMSGRSPETDRWAALKRLTSARIALGRAGGSLPTRALLDFAFDHAEAKDAVHAELDFDRLQGDLADIKLPIVRLATCVADRADYLQRPALGGRLDERSRELLAQHAALGSKRFDVAIAIADGLSATAAKLHAPDVARELVARLAADGFSLAPLVLARYARVAIEDEIGHGLGARLAVILLGERPGLGTSDSLGAYLVFDPRPGNTNAMRNCVSNIRPAGLPPPAAADALCYLIRESLRRQISGVELKDERVGSPIGETPGTKPALQ